MENFIKEAKLDFGMDTLSHASFLTNAVKLLIRGLAYNLISFMKRLVLSKIYQKSRLLTLRVIRIKVTGRLVRSGRSKYGKSIQVFHIWICFTTCLLNWNNSSINSAF